jgi:hypothetical protein
VTVHHERRGYPLRCVCGYEANDARDLAEHIVTAARHDEEPYDFEAES